jgi:hypothetical protein
MREFGNEASSGAWGKSAFSQKNSFAKPCKEREDAGAWGVFVFTVNTFFL